MFRQFTREDISDRFDATESAEAAVARSGQLDALVALDRIGTRRSYSRDNEIYADGDSADCWYKVVSGTVRICKLLGDGRRHISEFYFAGDCFGQTAAGARVVSAEAVGDVMVMRYPRRLADRLMDEDQRLARCLYDETLRDLVHSQARMLLLGRMTAAERVASFLLDVAERRDAIRTVDLPMSRNDIADYLGLAIETVCRVLSAFKRDGVIGIPMSHRIELCDREALEALSTA
jgi:CRP/FNR family transcriptional regulator, nitrogen fixation regulation protein